MRRFRVTVLGVAAAAMALTAAPALALPLNFTSPMLFGLGQRKPSPNLVFSYQGFQIDASAARRLQPAEKTVQALKTQVDLVEHVGLSPETLDLMRANRVLADPAPGGEAASYVPGQGVLIKIRRLEPNKPVLLVGLLKAYHDQRLAAGDAGRDLAHYRNEALGRRIWPKNALMLRSDTDYFALTGAAYLYGAITREPYSRAKLRETQPQYCRWLSGLFDDGHARG